jgi:hypothetical protein
MLLQLAWKHAKIDANAPYEEDQHENRHDCGHRLYPPVIHPDIGDRHTYFVIDPAYRSVVPSKEAKIRF